MASDSELKYSIIYQYQEVISALEAYDKEFPDSVPGHNAFVKLATNIHKRASVIGIDDYALDPLPPMK